jgi:transposase InsO family protein
MYGPTTRAGPYRGWAALPHGDVIDEYTRECLAIVVARRLTSDDVLQALTDLFVERGPPDHIRSDNGGEFTAKIVRAWLGRIGVRMLFIERGSP